MFLKINYFDTEKQWENGLAFFSSGCNHNKSFHCFSQRENIFFLKRKKQLICTLKIN